LPTYEYRCKTCGQHLEIVQAFTDDPLTECPTCSGELRKVFGAVGISFKGSGFYKTDSRSSSKTAASSSSGSDSSDGGSSSSSESSSGTSESKPASADKSSSGTSDAKSA
jgi:putative FmdB family regulatory protein